MTNVLTDVILLAPVNSTVFMTYGVLYDGGNKQMAIDKWKRDWFPLYKIGISFVPFLQIINFRFVPPKYQILYLNGIMAIWSIILSFYVNRKVDKEQDIIQLNTISQIHQT